MMNWNWRDLDDGDDLIFTDAGWKHSERWERNPMESHAGGVDFSFFGPALDSFRGCGSLR